MDVGTTFYGHEEFEDTHKDTQTGTGTSGTSTQITEMTEVTRSQNPYVYPATRRDTLTVDDYGDVKIVDPYRWLENPDSEETQAFIDEQNHLSESFIERAGWRDPIRAKLTEMWDFKKTECPKKFGSRYFYLENSGLQNQPILYVKESLDGTPRALMDPNELSVDGLASISNYSVSPNGDFVAYSLSESGSDWSSVYIKNVASGQNFLEVLNFVKATSIQWRGDNRAFFYSRYPKSKSGKVSRLGQDFSLNLNQKLYYHRVGTRQDDDVPIAEFPSNPTWAVSSQITLDGQYLLIFAGDFIGEQHTYYMEVGRRGVITRGIEMFPLLPEPGQHRYLANDDEVFYFLTNTDAPNFKIVSFNLSESNAKDEWTTIVSENPTAAVIWARVVATDKIAICYNEHLETRLEIRQLADGELLKAVVFDDNISTWDYAGQRESDDLFLRVESYLNPGILYRLSIDEQGEVETYVYEKIEIPYYDPSNFVSELVFYSNDDGTNVPMTLLYKNSTPLDGSASCLLSAYGGFGKSLLPEFHVPYVLFAQNFDGVAAIANIRGGSEYGTNWWNEGRLFNKENAIEDLTSAANFLVNNKYTRASRLTLMARSDGATSIAAAINKHPDLCGAAIVDVGVMDLLRFRNFTIGLLWVGEYGDVQKEDELKNILTYSPLHNISAPSSISPSYPAVLVTTADHDDRVVPFHSYKYIAELQHSVGKTSAQSNPLMARIYQNIGHESKSLPTVKAIEKATDAFCFMENALHYEFHF